MQLIAYLVLISAAAAGEVAPAAESTVQPPRLAEDPAGATEKCRQSWSRHGRISGEVTVTVWLDAHGRITGVATPPDTEPLAAQAAQCAVLGLAFDPATRDGKSAAGSLVVPIGFITPPSIRRSPEARQWFRCYPKSQRLEGIEGRVVLEVTIDPAGKIASHTVPEQTETWLVEAAHCIVNYFDFNPGLDRGIPVQATATLPVFFKNNEVRLKAIASVVAPTITGLRRREPVDEDPVPVSSEEEIIAAYQSCYPAGHDGTANITYEIRVGMSGEVQKVEIVEGSGDERLDQAGACILGKLKFRPATFNGYAVADTVHWPLLVRPPP